MTNLNSGANRWAMVLAGGDGMGSPERVLMVESRMEQLAAL